MAIPGTCYGMQSGNKEPLNTAKRDARDMRPPARQQGLNNHWILTVCMY